MHLKLLFKVNLISFKAKYCIWKNCGLHKCVKGKYSKSVIKNRNSLNYMVFSISIFNFKQKNIMFTDFASCFCLYLSHEGQCYVIKTITENKSLFAFG